MFKNRIEMIYTRRIPIKRTTRFIAIVLAVFFSTLLFSYGKNLPAEKMKCPNLLFIITDQQRFDALSFAGNTILKTPNLDRLAKEGVWFSNAHSQCPVCAPARSSILTGNTIAHTKIISNSVAYDSEDTGIMPMKTFDEILAENGYTCEYYGKWHDPTFRGRVYKNQVTVAGRSKSELGIGMKTAYLQYLNPYYPERELKKGELMDTYTERPYNPDPIDSRYEFAFQGKSTDEKPGQSDIHGVTSIPSEHHISALEASETIDALERLKNETFSLTCSFHHPHPPFLATEAYIKLFPPDSMILPVTLNDKMANSPYLRTKKSTSERYSDPEKIKYFISEYYALVKEVDDWIGKILDKLEELGLKENTLVIFTSDHGEMLGSHGMRSKNVFYEESSHIPLMMRFPGKIKPGTCVGSPVSQINLFATILDYLNMPSHPSDGRSLRGLIDGTDDKDVYVVTEWLSNLTTKPSHMVLKDGWKLLLPDSSAKVDLKALYNLNEDPYELNNLLGNTSDSEKYNLKVAELETYFQEWMKKTSQNQ